MPSPPDDRLPIEPPPRWASDGGINIVEPLSGRKDTGWENDDKPGAEVQNWYQELSTRYLRWIRDNLLALFLKNWFIADPPVYDNQTLVNIPCWDPRVRRWYHITRDIGNPAISMSPDGRRALDAPALSWTQIALNTMITVHSLAGNGLNLVACGVNGQIETITSGFTGSWVVRTSGFVTEEMRDVANNVGTVSPVEFVVVGDLGAITHSVDSGATWTVRSTPTASGNHVRVVFDPYRALWFAGNDSASEPLISSADGITWSLVTVPGPASGGVSDITFSEDRVYVLRSGGGVFGSTDGSTFIAITPPAGFVATGIVYINGMLILFDNVGSNPTNGLDMRVSVDDGVTWDVQFHEEASGLGNQNVAATSHITGLGGPWIYGYRAKVGGGRIVIPGSENLIYTNAGAESRGQGHENL